MFDLENAIENWRRPFVASPLYGRHKILELEDHLRESIDLELRHHQDVEVAFQRSIQKVGSEPTLRTWYLIDWKSRNPLVRYFLKMKSETNGFETSQKVYGYLGARTFTLFQAVVGLFAIEPIFVLVRSIIKLKIYSSPRIFEIEFPLLFLLLFLVSIFNLIPYSSENYTRESKLRVTFVIVCTVVLSYEWMLTMVGLNHQSLFQMALWTMTLFVGPFLWFSQMKRRAMNKDEVEITDVAV